MNAPRLAELNREIDEAEARLADLDHAIKPSAAAEFNGAAMDAHAAVSRELHDLQRRKNAILAGEGDPAERKPMPVIKKPTVIRSRPAPSETFDDKTWERLKATAKFIRETLAEYQNNHPKASWRAAIGFALAIVVDGQRTKNGELLARVDALERKQKDFRYRGVFSGAVHYAEGNFVTHHGSLWHANRATKALPGSTDDWTLAVKRGKDGNDADKGRR